METSESKVMNDDRVRANVRTNWDIDGMTEELFRELNESVSKATIEQMLCNLFAIYENAPVKSFVPVIVRRRAKDLLSVPANSDS